MIHTIELTTQVFVGNLPTTEVMETDTFTIKLYPTLLLNGGTHLLLAQPFLQSGNSSTFTNQIHILIYIGSGSCRRLVQCFRIAQICLSHSVQDTRLIYMLPISGKYIQRDSLADIITVLGRVESHIRIAATLKEVHTTVINSQPRAIIDDGNIEARLPVTIHIVSTFFCYRTYTGFLIG